MDSSEKTLLRWRSKVCNNGVVATASLTAKGLHTLRLKVIPLLKAGRQSVLPVAKFVSERTGRTKGRKIRLPDFTLFQLQRSNTQKHKEDGRCSRNDASRTTAAPSNLKKPDHELIDYGGERHHNATVFIEKGNKLLPPRSTQRPLRASRDHVSNDHLDTA
ncbi:unnamed protein product [Calypogeia fissa]